MLFELHPNVEAINSECIWNGIISTFPILQSGSGIITGSNVFSNTEEIYVGYRIIIQSTNISRGLVEHK